MTTSHTPPLLPTHTGATISPDQIYQLALSTSIKVDQMELTMQSIAESLAKKAPWYVVVGAVVGILAGVVSVFAILTFLAKVTVMLGTI